MHGALDPDWPWAESGVAEAAPAPTNTPRNLSHKSFLQFCIVVAARIFHGCLFFSCVISIAIGVITLNISESNAWLRWVANGIALWMVSMSSMVFLMIRFGGRAPIPSSASAFNHVSVTVPRSFVWARVELVEAVRWQKNTAQKGPQSRVDFETHVVDTLWGVSRLQLAAVRPREHDVPQQALSMETPASLSDHQDPHQAVVLEIPSNREESDRELGHGSVEELITTNQASDDRTRNAGGESSLGAEASPPQPDDVEFGGVACQVLSHLDDEGPSFAISRCLTPSECLPVFTDAQRIDVDVLDVWASSSTSGREQDQSASRSCQKQEHIECHGGDCGLSSASSQATPHSDSSRHELVCPCCFEAFTRTDTVALLQCGHIFCEECLVSWLRNSATCPVCRRCPLEALEA